MNAIIPIPKIPINVRLATMDDLSFIDALQKKHSKQLGFFPRAQMEGYLRNQWVLIAEESGSPIGYVAWRDRYQKRDELGAIFQLCVDDSVQRKLVGAMLVKSAFERSAYGCKLFCCWCAQDIEANRFWESMGFVPLAFRTGGRHKGTKARRHEGEDKGEESSSAFPSVPSCLSASVPSARIHIFWQKRIRAGDETTPYWFPSQTSSGAIREDRLVLPIPPGVRWDQVMPVILPGEERTESKAKALPGRKSDTQSIVLSPQSSASARALGGWGFNRAEPAKPIKPARGERSAKQKTPRVKQKNDPKLIAAARELRDRWMEKVNAGEYRIESQGKYEVSRLPGPGVERPSRLLIAA